MVTYENYKVLIVDDELDILKSLNRDLRKEPYEVLFANTGEQALKFFETESDIAVVVTDMRMPGMNGLQLLERINALSPYIVKIVLTGYTQLPQILATVNKVDIFKFLTKPWDLENELKVYIKEGIEQYETKKMQGDQLKSQEQKTKIFNKMLIESYEKADFLSHLFEQFSHALNFHHIITMQEMRTLKPDEDFETQLHMVFNQMKERVYYMNQIYDMNKFSLKSFTLPDLEIEVLSNLKKFNLDARALNLKFNTSKTVFRDNLRVYGIILSDFLQMFGQEGIVLVSSEIGQKANEIYPQVYGKVWVKKSPTLENLLQSKGKFIQQLIKNNNGSFVLESSEEKTTVELVVPIKPEHSIV